MKVVAVDPLHPEPASVRDAAAELRAGRLVAFPTETVYGLGAIADDDAAVASIFAAKGRPSTHPLIAHVARIDQARALASRWPDVAERVARAFWPGPLTVVVPRASRVSTVVTGGGDSVAVRVPAHPVALALLDALGAPVVAPSANRYQSLSPTRAEHVVASLAGSDVLVLDGGACPGGIESTVVDVRDARPRVLRPGGVSVAALRALLGDVAFEEGVVAVGERASPGLDARHYAPRARLRVVATRSEAIDASVGATLVVFGSGGPERARVLPAEPEGAARELYALLHALDAEGAREIVVEAPPSGAGWEGVRDRLRRASS